MEKPVLTTLRHASLFMRAAAGAVLVAFGGLVTAPAVAAVRSAPAPKSAVATSAASDESKMSAALLKVQERVDKLLERLQKHEDGSSERGELAQLNATLRQLDKSVLTNFETIGAQLKEKQLPEIIRARHTDAVATYQRERDQLLGDLNAIASAGSEAEQLAAAQKAKGHLDKTKLQRAQQPFNPNQLPFDTAKPHPERQPKTTEQEFVQAGLVSQPMARLAANGYDVSALADASDPAYLAETIEVRLTDAVKAKAAELDHNPVKIYNWVRNNVEWLPTWGSLQDADVTLGSLRGNAFDIASLTIALLRVSGIPARYVHGTIDVPADQFRNWAGGFQNVSEAMNFASSGGIPITGVVSGGQLAKARLEHVWVETAVDFVPSRGAVNLAADTWVRMDPSFKQYESAAGLDVLTLANIDPTAVTSSFAASGSSNETEGWVQGLDTSLIQTTQSQASTTVRDWLNRHPNATVGELLGGRQPVQQEAAGLPSSLSNTIVVAGSRYGEIPNRLRPTITFGFGVDVLGDLISGKSFAFAALNNHKVTLSFKPASTSDEQALASVLPTSVTDPSQLPASIPAYLIHVVPELKIDGQTVATGNATNLGADVEFDYAVTDLAMGTMLHPETVVAGSYLSVAVAAGSISPGKLESVRAKLRTTQMILAGQDRSLVAGLSREEILGDIFYAGTLGYFAELNTLGQLTTQQEANHVGLMTSAGTYGYAPKVSYMFGIPRAIMAGGAEMDLHRVAIVDNVDGKGSAAQFNLTFQLGALSSVLENTIPEQMFLSAANPGEGVSAVKALGKAAQQGQRVYHITPANQAVALANLHLSSLVIEEIRDALASGKEVIAHTDPISVPGWSGAGYVIYDPVHGAGAWKIGGSLNGGQESDVGFLDFTFAVANDPGLLIPTCSLPFLEQMVNNFFETNKAMFGLTVPPGLTLATGGVVAGAVGGFTFLKAIQLSWKAPMFLLGNLRVALMVAPINWVLMSIAFEIGMLIGSGISAAFCRRQK